MARREDVGQAQMGAAPPRALPRLFTPITLRGVTARNRIVVSPMSQYRLGGRRARPTGTWCISASSPWAAPASCSSRRPRSTSARARPITARASTPTRRQRRGGASPISCAAQGALQRDPARSRRPQGRHQGAVGRLRAAHRGRRQERASALARLRAEPDPVQARRRGADRDGSRRHQAGGREPRRRLRPLARCRLRHLRNPRRARLHHPAVPLADHQPPHRRLWRRPRRPHAVLRWS